MKRDMDLIREILLQVEAAPTDDKRLFIKVEGYSKEEIYYHTKLLYEADLIHVYTQTGIGVMGSRSWPLSLTSSGHDFLDAARDSTNWKKAKSIIGEKLGSTTLEILKEVLVSVAKGAVGLGG